MNLCDYDHDEICYEGRDCPLCEAQEKIKDLETELDMMKEEENKE